MGPNGKVAGTQVSTKGRGCREDLGFKHKSYFPKLKLTKAMYL